MVLTEEDFYYLLSLKPGEHMVSVWPEPMVNGVVIGIEGDDTTDLIEVAPGMMAPRIDRPFTIIRLRERLSQITGEMRRGHGGDRDAYLRALGEAVEREIFPQLYPQGDPTVS